HSPFSLRSAKINLPRINPSALCAFFPAPFESDTAPDGGGSSSSPADQPTPATSIALQTAKHRFRIAAALLLGEGPSVVAGFGRSGRSGPYVYILHPEARHLCSHYGEFNNKQSYCPCLN